VQTSVVEVSKVRAQAHRRRRHAPCEFEKSSWQVRGDAKRPTKSEAENYLCGGFPLSSFTASIYPLYAWIWARICHFTRCYTHRILRTGLLLQAPHLPQFTSLFAGSLWILRTGPNPVLKMSCANSWGTKLEVKIISLLACLSCL